MSKYSIEDTTLTSIADAVREKGGTTEPIVVSGLAAAIAGLPTGGGGEALDFLTNTDDYDVTKYTLTIPTTPIASVVLPDGVTVDDIVFIMGIGGPNNRSSSARTSQHISYIYCPALLKREFEYVADSNTTDNGFGGRVFACFGFPLGNASTTYEAGLDWGTGETHYGTFVYFPYLRFFTNASGENRMQLVYTSNIHSASAEAHAFGSGYSIAQYAECVVITKKKTA